MGTEQGNKRQGSASICIPTQAGHSVQVEGALCQKVERPLAWRTAAEKRGPAGTVAFEGTRFGDDHS